MIFAGAVGAKAPVSSKDSACPFFFFRTAPCGATSSNAAINFVFHSFHIGFIPELVKVPICRASASSIWVVAFPYPPLGQERTTTDDSRLSGRLVAVSGLIIEQKTAAWSEKSTCSVIPPVIKHCSIFVKTTSSVFAVVAVILVGEEIRFLKFRDRHTCFMWT